MSNHWCLLALVVISASSLSTLEASVLPGGRKVVLMSMDGFRHDYLTKFNISLTNFDALIASGVKVPYVNNTFVTLTFPCHYTIVSGRYEESHGIMANDMYDPVFNATFSAGTKETRWWNDAEPIWINAVKSNLKVGTFFWPGSEVELEGVHPTQWRDYNESVPFEERVDTVVTQWLAKDDFDFGVIYFNEPDSSGHLYGPDDPMMIPVIKRMDAVLGYFMKKLEDENLKGKVDFILTSDHGMTNIDLKTMQIALDEHVNDTLLDRVITQGPIAHLIPQPGKSQELKDALSGIANMTVYLKEEIPEHYHYKNHRRVMPVVAVADEGWSVTKTRVLIPNKGNHGYDNAYMSMKPIFIATGPSFKQGEEAAPIKSVDIYPLLCHLLGIEEAPNNGSIARVAPLLSVAPSTTTMPITTTAMETTTDGAGIATGSFLSLLLPFIVLSFHHS